MPKFIGTTAFCEKYDLGMKAVTLFVFYNKNKPYVKKVNFDVFIDVEHLEEHQTQLKRMWLASHEYYYHLLGRLDITQDKLAKLISVDHPNSAWIRFLSVDMWHRIDTRSILTINISNVLLETFVKWCEEVIPQIEYRLKQKEKQEWK